MIRLLPLVLISLFVPLPHQPVEGMICTRCINRTITPTFYAAPAKVLVAELGARDAFAFEIAHADDGLIPRLVAPQPTQAAALVSTTTAATTATASYARATTTSVARARCAAPLVRAATAPVRIVAAGVERRVARRMCRRAAIRARCWR